MAAAVRSVLASAAALRMLPRTAVRVSIQELSNDGGLLAAAVNAAMAALADAGIPCYGLVAAACEAIADAETPASLADPCAAEENDGAYSCVTVATLPSECSEAGEEGGGDVVLCEAGGGVPARARVSAEALAAAVAAARAQCAATREEMASALEATQVWSDRLRAPEEASG